jgi:methyl-accepting chemotaxis protein
MSNKHILVVDDELTIRKTLLAILRKQHHQVTEADSGAQALSLAKQQQFDLVLTDVLMPQMDGFSLIDQLRMLPNYASIPIACLSGTTKEEAFALHEDKSIELSRLDIHDWLTKPIIPKVLIERVSDLLTHRDHDHLLAEEGSKYVISSTTGNLEGKILSCSKGVAFNTGYTVDELIGQPHSVFRHPDVPDALYVDLWETIQSGHSWVGVVKNRRKDGTGYWVSLQILPVIDDGKVVAYKSVRFPATEKEITQTEALYRDIKAGVRSYPPSHHSAKEANYAFADILLIIAILLPSLVLLMSGVLSTSFALPMMLFSLLTVGFAAYRLRTARKIPTRLRQSIEDLMNDRLRIQIAGRSELAQVLERFRVSMSINLANRHDLNYEDSFNQAVMSMITSNLLLLNEDFRVVALSSSMQAFFIRNEDKMRTVIPNFDANNLIGSPLNILQVFAKHIRVSSDKQSTGCIEFDLANLIIRLRSQKITDAAGNVRSYILELQDRTEQTLVIKQISHAIEAMKDGDFSVRVTAEAYDPDLMFIKNDINSAMDRLAMTLEVVVSVVMAQSDGDMTNELKGDYHGQFEELQRVMNVSVTRLRDVLKQTQEATNVVNQTSSSLIDRSAYLAEQSKVQSSAMRDTNDTMNMIASSVQANTQHAKTVASLTHQVQQQTQLGADVMQQTIAAMQEIQASSHKISEIVTLIDSIAFQTNLLALNAAVEAARAGEHGRGFAVVAGEVRTLALKSANAAKDIKSLINDSVSRIKVGTGLADKSGLMLSEIAQAINQVASMVEEIAGASVTQSRQIDSVHQAISGINQVTAQYDASVAEIVGAAQQLSQEAKQLEESTAFFKLGKDTDGEAEQTEDMLFF